MRKDATMSDLDLTHLETLAMAAGDIWSSPDGTVTEVYGVRDRRDATFIAATNPETVLALCAEVRRLRLVEEATATLRDELARVTEERDRLRAHLEVAIDLAEEGWGYASEYFCQKWGFDERVLALRTVAGVGADESLPTDEAARILSLETNAETMRASDEGKRDDE
jgi:hypothetical protein